MTSTPDNAQSKASQNPYHLDNIIPHSLSDFTQMVAENKELKKAKEESDNTIAAQQQQISALQADKNGTEENTKRLLDLQEHKLRSWKGQVRKADKAMQELRDRVAALELELENARGAYNIMRCNVTS